MDDADQCVELIVEHKFTTEVVHGINNLQAQQKSQLAGIQEFKSVVVSKCGSILVLGM